MKLEYELTIDDYIEFNYQSVIESKVVFNFFLFQKIVVAITFLLVIFWLSTEVPYPIWVWVVFYIGLLGIWTILERIIIKRVLKNFIKKEAEANKEELGKKTILVSDENIIVKDSFKERLINWEEIKFIDDREEYVFIFLLEDPSYIIPKRYFKTEKEKDKFLKCIESNIILEGVD